MAELATAAMLVIIECIWPAKQVGCPESGIEEAVQRLTAAGYKVGRVEQTETAAEAKRKRGNKVCLWRSTSYRLGAAHTVTRVHVQVSCSMLSEALLQPEQSSLCIDVQATIQRELTRIETPATMASAHVSPEAVHLMVWTVIDLRT